MKEEEIIRLGAESIDLWQKRVHALINIYKKLEEEAKKGGSIDKQTLLEQAKGEALKVK